MDKIPMRYRFVPWRLSMIWEGQMILTPVSVWELPKEWDAQAKAEGERGSVSLCADVFRNDEPKVYSHRGYRMIQSYLGDVWDDFDEYVEDFENYGDQQGFRPLTPEAVKRRLFGLISSTPNLDWTVGTEHPENIAKLWPSNGFPGAGIPGTLGKYISVENLTVSVVVSCQDDADTRIPELLKSPADKKGIVMTPQAKFCLSKWLRTIRTVQNNSNEWISIELPEEELRA